MCLLTVAAGGVIFPALSLSEMFVADGRRSLILALMNGSFDSATIVFYMFNVSGERLSRLFSAWTVLAAVLVSRPIILFLFM